MAELNDKKRKLEDDSAEVHHPHKKRRIEFDQSTNIDLPAEIMLEIFDKLSPNDFNTCMEVCKYWHECSSTFLGWALIGINDYFNTTTDHTKLLGDNPSVRFPNSKGHYVRWAGNCLSVENDQKETLCAIKLDLPKNASYDGVTEAYIRNNDSVICPEWKFEFQIKKAAPYHVKVHLYISIRALVQASNSDKLSTFPKLDLVFKHGVDREVARVISKESYQFRELKKSIIPYMPPKLDPPTGLKEGFKWHRYQLECISWMKSIEQNTDKEFKYCDLVPWRASRSPLLFDLHNQKIVTPDAVSEYIGSFKARGGILADAVGLGKTLEMIGLALATQEKSLPEFDENGLYNTKASLIICASHIAMQWASEIAKFTDLKVTQLTNITEASEVTYGDIIDSDFIIVSVNLLKSKPFMSLALPKNKAVNSFAAKAFKIRAENLRQILEEVKAKKGNKRGNSLQVQGPPLDHFHFRRVIVDEAHEVFLDNFVITYLSNQAIDARWYVSATPFPSEGLFEAAKKFLGIWEPDFTLKKSVANNYENFVENDLIMNNLVWRNTKESIADEYEVPDYEEHVEWVECHPIEALQYAHSRSLEHWMTLDGRKDAEIRTLEYQIRYHYMRTNEETYKKRLEEWQKVPYVLTAKTPSEDQDRLKLINELGSKVARVVTWLKESMEDESNRFLFFTKNQQLLSQIGRAFREQNIPFVSFEGNVHQKVKKLQDFKEENVRVMLLSLAKSASGLNLIEANHVVLLDPMSGSVEESRAYELQALGRAHRQGQDQKVQLVRFVMLATNEEELYNRNKSSGRVSVDTQKASLKRSSSAIQMLNRSSSATSLRQLAEK